MCHGKQICCIVFCRLLFTFSVVKHTHLISLYPEVHKDILYIAIASPKEAAILEKIRSLPGRRYSASKRLWLVPLSRENYKLTYHALQPVAELDTSKMKIYFAKQGKKQITEPIVEPTAKPTSTITKSVFAAIKIYEVNAHVLPAMQQMLDLKGYSPSTKRTYLGEMKTFLHDIKTTGCDTLVTERIKDYLQYLHNEKGLSENGIHSQPDECA